MKKQLLLSLAVLSSLGTINADGLLSRLAGFLNIRSQKLTFDHKNMVGFENTHMGDIEDFEFPARTTTPLPTQKLFLSALRRLESGANKPGSNIGLRCHPAFDPFEKGSGCGCGSTLSMFWYVREDELSGRAVAWNASLTRAIPSNSWKPSEEFYHYVMDAEARQHHFEAHDTLFR